MGDREMTRVLIAEDEKPIREGLIDLLGSEGYKTFAAENGDVALDVFKETQIDLALLDIMMPGKSGYDVCREIRKIDEQLPIIFLTAREEEIDKVIGLELGADDYIVKPFGVRELLARIKTVLRRSEKAQKGTETISVFDFAGGTVDTKRYSFRTETERFDLTEREVDLLRFFYHHPDEVLSRDILLERFWGIEYTGTTRTLDQHIAKLRQKIEHNPKEPKYIITVHGTGYRYMKRR